jgi:uncharacterized protein YdhG (YjbR/CyaY superfamily)
MNTQPASIDDYIAAFPADVQARLTDIRTTIRAVAPRAEESISYAIPTFKLDDRLLVYFAAYKHHISIYPIPAGDAELSRDLASHVAGKGTLRFALDRPLPLDLIRRIVAQRVAQHAERAAEQGAED